MKQILILTFFVSALFFSNAALATHDNGVRYGCPGLIMLCGNGERLIQEEFAPSDSVSAADANSSDDFTSGDEDINNACRSCCVSESKTSKCINRCLTKCRKNFEDDDSTDAGDNI